MARSDLLVKLVKAGVDGDHLLFRRTVEAMIAEEEAQQHHVLARRLADQLKPDEHPLPKEPKSSSNHLQNLMYEMTPRKDLDDLVLPTEVISACREIVEEHHRSDLLRSYALEPRHRVLLAGPPGNGKTSLAESLANALMVPMFVVRYEGVVASYLGETAQRLRPLHLPSPERQKQRLDPKFDRLQQSMENRRIALQIAPSGVEPEMVLVLETAGKNVDDFLKAVRHIDGRDWLGDWDEDDLLPDEDFYYEGDRTKALQGRLYLVMSDHRALNELLSLWNRWPNQSPGYGLTKWRDLFQWWKFRLMKALMKNLSKCSGLKTLRQYPMKNLLLHC